MQPLLLDTCALILLNQKASIAAGAVAALRGASDGKGTTYVSPVSAWEVGLLAARGRLQLLIKPERWFAALFEVPGVTLAALSPEVLVASSSLPGDPPDDAIDRILAATARELGATLITRGRALIDYGAQGHVRVVAC